MKIVCQGNFVITGGFAMAPANRRNTSPEVIRREMENLKQLTGGEDAFDIVENMGDLWQALDKWAALEMKKLDIAALEAAFDAT